MFIFRRTFLTSFKRFSGEESAPCLSTSIIVSLSLGEKVSFSSWITVVYYRVVDTKRQRKLTNIIFYRVLYYIIKTIIYVSIIVYCNKNYYNNIYSIYIYSIYIVLHIYNIIYILLYISMILYYIYNNYSHAKKIVIDSRTTSQYMVRDFFYRGLTLAWRYTMFFTWHKICEYSSCNTRLTLTFVSQLIRC